LNLVRLRREALLLLGVLAGFAVGVSPLVAGEPPASAPPPPPSEQIVKAVEEAPLRGLLESVLERNPRIAALEASARAAAQKAPQARALPDPMLGVTAYPLAPQTRVGPQQASVSLSQRFPWFGRLGLQEQAAVHDADAARDQVESARLRMVTESRRLYYELGFLQALEQAVREDRATLAHYEELARARYASGVGLDQAVVKIQAEITRDDARLLDFATQQARQVSRLNALRDRPEGTAVQVDPLPRYGRVRLDHEALRGRALGFRPELAEARARTERARALTGVARRQYVPDVTLGLTYTFVGDRTDPAGRAMPPPDDGQDILGVAGGVNLPIWWGKLRAGVREGLEGEASAAQMERSVITGIDQSLGDLLVRIPLTWDRLNLFEKVLGIQAEQSLRSAEAAYAAGTLGALDLLGAEGVLLDVKIATARARADYATALAELEGAVGGPVAQGRDPQNGTNAETHD